LGRAGFELKPQKSTQRSIKKEVKNQMFISPNLERVQNTVHNSNVSAELEEVVANWGALPEYIRKAISTLIRSNAK
jgi:hypothetical protein